MDSLDEKDRRFALDAMQAFCDMCTKLEKRVSTVIMGEMMSNEECSDLATEIDDHANAHGAAK